MKKLCMGHLTNIASFNEETASENLFSEERPVVIIIIGSFFLCLLHASQVEKQTFEIKGHFYYQCQQLLFIQPE